MSCDEAAFGPVKYGKLEPRSDIRTLRLEKYLTAQALPEIPKTFDLGSGVAWQMWLNNRIGDCTCASVAGWVALWTSLRGKQVTLTDQDVLTAYEAVSGYDPRTGLNDNGAVELDVLKLFATRGVGGHTCEAYGDIGVQDLSMVVAAIWICEGLMAGSKLPAYCEQTNLWDGPGPIAGGHAFIVTGFDGTYFIAYTWGGRKIRITPAFLLRYFDELHFALAKDQFGADGKAANSLDLATMQADIQAVGRLDTPPVVIPPVVVPPVPPGPAPTPAPNPSLWSRVHIPAHAGDTIGINLGSLKELRELLGNL